jgi:hypothetical protein
MFAAFFTFVKFVAGIKGKTTKKFYPSVVALVGPKAGMDISQDLAGSWIETSRIRNTDFLFSGLTLVVLCIIKSLGHLKN